jgi:hypothetical protein
MSHELDININGFHALSLCMKIEAFGLAVCAIMLVGLLLPWITKGYDSYAVMNPETRMGELRFHKKILLSPVLARLYEDGELVETMWFVSPGTALAGVMIASTAALSPFKFKRRWIRFSLFIMAVLGIVVFFMSLGMGLGIGLRTGFGWGLPITILGIVLIFSSSINELSRPVAH